MALRKKKINKPAKVPAERKFFILWSPQSGKPPKIRFTRKKAEEVADTMVKKYHQEFFVMQSVSLHRPGVPERVPYTGREAKQPSIKAQIEARVKTRVFTPIWRTYNEWKAQGFYVRAGEHGTIMGGERKFSDQQVKLKQPSIFDMEDDIRWGKG